MVPARAGCSPCPPGTLSESLNTTSCGPCPSGGYCTAEGAAALRQTYTPCDAGRLLAAPDGLDTVGIFRLSADEAELRAARRALDAGAAYEEALRDAAGVLLAALIKAAPLARTIPLASVPFTAPLTN